MIDVVISEVRHDKMRGASLGLGIAIRSKVKNSKMILIGYGICTWLKSMLPVAKSFLIGSEMWTRGH